MSTPSLSTPASLSMSRSPLFVTGKNNALTNDRLNSMSLNVKIYTGAKTSPPASNNYSLSKSISVDEIINFEISDLVRDGFLHPFGKFNITAPSASEVGEVLWVSVSGDWIYSDNGAAPDIAIWLGSEFLTTEGWTKRGEAQNRPTAGPGLTIERKHKVYSSFRESLAALYIASNGLNGLMYEINGAKYWYILEDELGFASNSNESQNKVIYIPSGVLNVFDYVGVMPSGSYSISLVTNSEGADYPARVTADGGVVEGWGCLMNAIDALGGQDKTTYDYDILCETKYEPQIIQYVNRYGVSDYVTFFKRSDESGQFTNDSYRRSIYADGFTEPDLKTPQYQDFNINSRNSITLNTGYVEEAYKDVIEEILMSEKVSILEGGNYRSVTPQRGSVEYFKEVNTGNINYSMTFDYAFNERNLIR